MRESQAHSRIGPSALISARVGRWCCFCTSGSTAKHRASAPDASEHTPQRHRLRLLLLLNLDASAHHGFHKVNAHPTTSHSLLLFAVTGMWDGAGVQLSVTSSAEAGGSEAFALGPADPEIDTRACQPRRDKRITCTSGYSSARGTICAACGCTRVVGGLAAGPRFVSSWLLASA